jgi:hypothetical protein
MIFSEDKGAGSCCVHFSKLTGHPELHKRTIQHVANTEQRIMFKEVTLQPKSRPASPKHSEMPSEAPEPSKTSESTAQVQTVLDIDGQRIDRMTGKAAPLTRAPRTKASTKKKAGELEDNTAKGKEKQALDSDPVAPPLDSDMVIEKEAP